MNGMVSRANHFLYVCPFNEAGVPDWYTYIDTVYPIRGRHPYTKDRWTGQSWLGDDVPVNTDPIKLIPDVGKRLEALDGLLPVVQM